MKQKLIMEGWRDFVNKITGAGYKTADLYENMGLWTFLDGGRFDIILYIPSSFSDGNPILDDENEPDVVGYLQMELLSDKEDPCIPNTWHVKYSATSKKYQKKGIGTMLYEMAATYAKLGNDGGITSDHDVLTSNAAARRWAKITSNSNFEKRKTKSGSDTFDYSGKDTPNDPDDDCRKPKVPKNTVDHSMEIKKDVKDKLDKYKKNHRIYAKKSKMADLNRTLLGKASKVFTDSFVGE